MNRYEHSDGPAPFICEVCGTNIPSGGFLSAFDFRDGHDPAPHRFDRPECLRDWSEQVVLADHPDADYSTRVAEYFATVQENRDELKRLRDGGAA